MNNRKRKKLPKRLAAAAGDGRVALLQRLLAQGADPDTRDPDGATPLYLAAVQGENRCAELLLAAGASPNAESRGGAADCHSPQPPPRPTCHSSSCCCVMEPTRTCGSRGAARRSPGHRAGATAPRSGKPSWRGCATSPFEPSPPDGRHLRFAECCWGCPYVLRRPWPGLFTGVCSGYAKREVPGGSGAVWADLWSMWWVAAPVRGRDGAERVFERG